MHFERIDPKAAQTLRKFQGNKLMDEFYLSGGTALALQMGHRISVDLDFFTQKPVHKVNTDKIMAELQRRFINSKITVTFRAVDQIWMDIDGVKITFLAYPFERKHPLIQVDGIALADVRDIALQKAFSIGRRAAARDYVDLAWILRNELITLEEICRDALDVFVEDGEHLFSPKLFFQQLVYIEDLEDKDVVIRQLHVPYDFDSLMSILMNAVNGESERTFNSSSKTRFDSYAGHFHRRVCTSRCKNSKAPVSTCRCVCGGKNHGIRNGR